jgi:glycosyltransferase involved in cell wall biosynthesis
VATDCGGMREAVRDGIDGYLVPPRDADAMAAALGRLAGDGPGRRRMGASGRARVCDAFTLDRQVAEFRTLYNAAMGNAR